MSYALKLDGNRRILSATFEKYAAAGMPIVDSLPSGDITNYRYVDGEYSYDPSPAPTPEATWEEKVEAQMLYTALMTDTLIEEE